MTYSIVARDPVTGEMGVAVQTAIFGVGAIVPWSRAGVGVVASQAIAEPAYGPRCLDALEQGANASAALAAAIEQDDLALLRQVGVVGADGSVAAHTGEWCIDHAGDHVGDGFSVQANMMASPEVWPAMATAFTASSGTLARRMLAALVAGQSAGGDARGVMSAALVVVSGEKATPWATPSTDLRVDSSAAPLDDLAALLDDAEAYARFSDATDRLMAGDPSAALDQLRPALAARPVDENIRFLQAGALLASGQIDDGATILRDLIAKRPSWEVVVRSFADKGLVAMPAGATVDDLLA